jgi:uncharacterized protein
LEPDLTLPNLSSASFASSARGSSSVARRFSSVCVLKGNRQYLSFGNFQRNPRVSLFLIDYPGRARLKIFGQAKVVEDDEIPEALRKIGGDPGDPTIERAVVIQVEAFHWNCPKYIVPRFTEAQVRTVIDPLVKRIKELEAELARLSAQP